MRRRIKAQFGQEATQDNVLMFSRDIMREHALDQRLGDARVAGQVTELDPARSREVPRGPAQQHGRGEEIVGRAHSRRSARG